MTLSRILATQLASLGRAGGGSLWAVASKSPHASRQPAAMLFPTSPCFLQARSLASTMPADQSEPTGLPAKDLAICSMAPRFFERARGWFPDSERTSPERGPMNWWYWTEQRDGDGGPVLMQGRPKDPKWTGLRRTVLDTAAALDGLRATGGIASVSISPCGGFVAFAADAAGEPCVSVRDIQRSAEVARIMGARGVEWGAAGSGDLFYTRDKGGDGRPCEVRMAAGLVAAGLSGAWWRAGLRHRGISDAATHPLLLAWPDERSHLALGRTKDGRWLTATAVRRDAALPHVLRLDGEGSGPCAFTPVGGGDPALNLEACVETFVESDGRGGLLLLTNERSGGRVKGNDGPPVSEHEVWLGWAPGPATPPSDWTLLIRRRRDRVITDIDVYLGGETANAILLYERETEFGAPELSLVRLRWRKTDDGLHLPWRTKPVLLSPPADGADGAEEGPSTWACIKPGANAWPHARTARIVASSPLARPRAWNVNLRNCGRSLQPLPRAEVEAAKAVAKAAAGLALRRLTIPSTDGTVDIPLTVLEPVQCAQHAPQNHQPSPPGTLLVLYGAYGIPLEPDFEPLWLTLAAEGWRIVLAGGRGGGELGRGWHAAGRGPHRPAAAADAEAAADWAGGEGRQIPVVVSAESAGGLLAGHLLQRGGLAGAILRAPFLNIAAGVGPDAGPVAAALAAHETGEWSVPWDGAARAAACPTTRLASLSPPPTFPPVRIVSGLDDERVPVADIESWMRAWEKAAGPGRSAETETEFLPGVGHEGPQGEDALIAMAKDAAFAVRAAALATAKRVQAEQVLEKVRGS